WFSNSLSRDRATSRLDTETPVATLLKRSVGSIQVFHSKMFLDGYSLPCYVLAYIRFSMVSFGFAHVEMSSHITCQHFDWLLHIIADSSEDLDDVVFR